MTVGARLAAIDVGSNSIHMVVVEVEPGGGLRVLDRERDMVRLGRSAHGAGALSEKAIRDGLLTLTKMSTLARLKGAERIVAVATSAVREASNGDEFIARVKARTGLELRILSGEEEGRLILRAVREGVDLGNGFSIVVDVGGGSTEWIVARGGEARQVVSLELGSLRLARQLVDSRSSKTAEPPSRAAIVRLRNAIRESIAKLRVPARLERFVATSGTAVACADLIAFLAGRDWKAASGVLREVRARDLTDLVDHLRRLTRSQLAALPPVGAPRSESIVAGAILIDELVRHAGVERFFVSDRALREGVVLESLGRSEAGPASADVRGRQIQALAERCPAVLDHSREAARLSTRLFDLTRSLHGLGEREREWLEYGAMLHDLGYLVDYRKHQRHGYYLVHNAALDAFDPREIEILAHLVRFHRGTTPSAKKHPSFAALRPWQQRVVERLVAILQIGDAFDRTHAGRVKEIYCAITKKKVRLEVVSKFDVTLELDAARQHTKLFERLFGREVTVRRGLKGALKGARRAKVRESGPGRRKRLAGSLPALPST